MKTAVIIDDIKIHRDSLKELVARVLNDQVKVIGEADGICEGLTLLKKVTPDLLFLDIELPPEGSGFDLLSHMDLSKTSFNVIFITQYDQYAIKAFEFSAIGYILKPIDEKKLISAFNNYIYLGQRMQKIQFDVAVQHYRAFGASYAYMILRSSDGIPYKINYKDIICCQARNNYCVYYIANNPNFKDSIVTNTLGKEIEKLRDIKFLKRVHRSYLINYYHIKRFIYNKLSYNGSVILSNNMQVEISRDSMKQFKEWYGSF